MLPHTHSRARARTHTHTYSARWLTKWQNNIRVTDAFESVARDVKNRLMKDGVGAGKADAKGAPVVVKEGPPTGGAAAGGCCGGGQ